MKFGLYLLMALDNMIQHKLRTFLTLLGLIVGIASVLVMTGMGRGYAVDLQQMLAELLPNKITIQPDYSAELPPTLTLREVALLQKKVNRTLVTAIAPKVDLSGLPIKGVDPNMSWVMVTATTADYPQMTKLAFTQGRFFTPEEAESETMVAVVNQDLLNLLQQGGQTDLTTITIDNKILQIVGVIDTSSSFYMYQPQLFLPINLLEQRLHSQNLQLYQGSVMVNSIDVLAVDVAHVQQARHDLERIFRLYYGLRTDQATTVQIFVDRANFETFENSTQTFTLVLAGIGGVALLVGGIGIMNILLASVSERTREIGLRKAIGANNGDILFQFLMEAITVCLTGGLLGVGFSYGVGALINRLFGGPESAMGIRILIDYTSVLIAAGSSVACGLIFGLYPALRAMRLNPIQALRYE